MAADNHQQEEPHLEAHIGNFNEGNDEDDEMYLDVTMFDEDDEYLEGAMAAPEDEDTDPYYFVRSRKTGARSDVYSAARVGDLDRVKVAVEEEGVDVNQRDRWDSVPLYYACLAGHTEVAQYLLEAGAVCNEYTFDGDRCHYAALTSSIRALLRQYEQRPPPLAPLAASLRSLTPLCDDIEAPTTSSRRVEGPWCDFAFILAGERITLHRAILAARSPFFRKKLMSDWQLTESEESSYRTVQLKNAALSPSALKAVLAFMYTERLDIPIEEVDAVMLLARKCRLRAVEQAIAAEQRTLKYYFKSTRKHDEGPRRFVLQPGSLPDEYRLPAQLGRLRKLAHHLEQSGEHGPSRDFADIFLNVQERIFRCHRCVLSARSDYFQAFLSRSGSSTATLERGGAAWGCGSANASEPSGQDTGHEKALPCLRLSNVTSSVFEIVLHYIYSDCIAALGPEFLSEEGAEQLFDAADRYLIFTMKRRVSEVIIRAWEARAPPLEALCRMLLVADRFGAMLLRERCLHALAARFDALAEDRAPAQEREVFEAFIAAVAPNDADDLFDGSYVAGASHGAIEGSGVGGLGMGTILQDLREAYLEDFGGDGDERDQSGDFFDARLQEVATCAFEKAEDE